MKEGVNLHQFVAVNRRDGEVIHTLLKEHLMLNPDLTPQQIGKDEVAFPLAEGTTPEAVAACLNSMHPNLRFCSLEATIQPLVDPHRRLTEAVSSWVDAHGGAAHADLLALIPSKWERLGGLILLPAEVNEQPPWLEVMNHPKCDIMWLNILKALKAESLGLQAPIANDTFRSSQVKMLHGSSEVDFLDHGITYSFDAARVMFSSGNITERRRIGAINMQGETVIDAYAGVGYYTFPMLVHSDAAHVHACELNPASIQGLRAGADANKVNERLTVHEGDNQISLTHLSGIADRCHLGLLPSSEAVWELAIKALKSPGGWLHVHMNVEEERIPIWIEATRERFQEYSNQHGLGFQVHVRHLERVKWFAPFVRHVVLDLECRRT